MKKQVKIKKAIFDIKNKEISSETLKLLMSNKAYKEVVRIFKIIKKNNKFLKKLNLHEPFFNKDEYLELKNCLQSTFVSSSGNFLNKFSNSIKNKTNARYVIPLINGTSAIHLSLIALGLEKNQEVLMPTLNYVASANATIYLNGILIL